MSKEYDGYLQDQSHKKLDLCGICGQPKQKVCTLCCKLESNSHIKDLDTIQNTVETLVVRFNELCRMLSVQLANSSFSILTIQEEDEEAEKERVKESLRKSGDLKR